MGQRKLDRTDEELLGTPTCAFCFASLLCLVEPAVSMARVRTGFLPPDLPGYARPKNDAPKTASTMWNHTIPREDIQQGQHIEELDRRVSHNPAAQNTIPILLAIA